ncbi:MAG TPA: HAMP domain-containing sensor histidine kinase [Steroidobacteraceae bacterium]|nr:HAMP domain-containing sensor histidine kinase [Steroidobacteraceae bacterium]
MRGALPKSLNGYLLLGIILIGLPLLAAIVRAALQMSQLHDFGSQLVRNSVQTAKTLQELFRETDELNVEAQLYLIVGGDANRDKFNQQDRQLAVTVSRLRGLQSGATTWRALDSFTALQRDIVTRISDLAVTASAENRRAGQLATPYTGPLKDQYARVEAAVEAQINAELDSLTNQTARAQRELALESSLLILLVLAVALSIALGIGRPLRQIDRAITELGSGNFARAIAVSGPVDLQRLGQQLEWLRSRLLELAQERNRFLRHMSHELKTPLANIREGTELLMEGAVGELAGGQREVVAILQDNSIKLQRMIENLLSYSAWQSNSIGLDPSEFRLRPLVKQVLENQQLTLVSQRVRLDVQVDDLSLHADRGKLRLILENLLSNAIKYSPRGGTITVRARASDAEVIMEVADGGAGIPRADRAHVFEAFHTGRAPGGHVRGTGIGLSVVYEFVQVHRGSIEIVDGEFPGAHFRIRLPRHSVPTMVPVLAPGANRRNVHAA